MRRKRTGSNPEGCSDGSSRLPQSLGAEDVVDFERLVDLGEPFRPVGGPAAATLVERQFQLAQQARDLLARRDVTHVRPGTERRLVKIVERGQPARKKLAVNDAFGETVDRAE